MLVSCLLSVVVASADPAVGVMDFSPQGASPELAGALSSLTSHELENLGVFKVTSAEVTRVMLGLERQRQMLGCEDCSATNLSDLVDVQYLVTGKVMVAPSGDERYGLLLTLIDVRSSRPVSSARGAASSELALTREVRPTLIKLLGKLLQDRQGSLVLLSSEVGAAVRIDDTQVGTTPLPGRLALGAGPHLLTVSKDGFAAVRREVRIRPGEVSEEQVRLVPSPDTIAAYEARAGRLRLLAWLSGGVAALGAGALAVGQLRATGLYGDDQSPGTFAFHRAALLHGLESETLADGTVVDHRTAALRLKSEIETMQTIAWVGFGAAAVGAVASVVLFVVGDPPNKYAAYHGQLAVELSPTLTGLRLTGSF